MTITVVGTNLSVAVDGAGRFELRGVPPGDVQLQFTAPSIDARVTISGVGDHDQIRITVNVNGSSAELDENEHQMAGNQTELDGRVASTNCAATQITVGTTTPTVVNLTGARIRHDGSTLTCADIQLNDRVEVHGIKNGTTINATDVNVKTDHGVPPVQNEAEVKGIVSGAAPGHACPFTFMVGSTSVTTSAGTKFENTTCAEVVNGITVEVKGTRTSPTAIAASKVEKK
jgi:hypothetical protein